MAKILEFKLPPKKTDEKPVGRTRVSARTPQEIERYKQLRSAFETLIDHVLDGSLGSPDSQITSVLSSTIECIDTAGNFEVRFALPGFEREQVRLFFVDGSLKLQFYLAPQEGGRALFSQTVPLPAAVNPDQIQATMEDELLVVQLPKKTSQPEVFVEIPID